MGFALDLRKFADKAKDKVDLVVGKIVIDVATSLVYKSPVGDAEYWKSEPPEGYVGGRFRGNWQFGIGGVNEAVTSDIDANGSSTISNITAQIPEDAGGKIYYITNSLPYAQRLEEGWSYRQAPNGMVGITVLEFQPIVDKVAESL